MVHAILPAAGPAQALADALWRRPVAIPRMVACMEPRPKYLHTRAIYALDLTCCADYVASITDRFNTQGVAGNAISYYR